MLDWSAHPTDTRMNWATHAHGYQKAGAAHLFQNRAATLWLDPGYGKTMITLHAFKALWEMGLAKHMLVVAPKRVMQTVWAQEIDNWSSLQGLRAARLHGTKKEKWLKRTDVNVWVINYEGLPWLAKMAKEGKVPFKFDVIVFDEIRRMKNAQGKRFKAVRPMAALAGWVWGATGTPGANGLLDLFGQFLILDGGEALGTRITRFRHDYFELGFDGFTWIPRPGAREAIEAKIGHMVYRVTDMIDVPEFVMDPRVITLEPDARSKYNTMKKDLITEIGDGALLEAANAAVLYGKLKQMAQGRVYDADRNVIHIHDAKQEALEDLVDELGDEQLLIAYEYNHDLEQIRAVLGDDIPYLGSGVSEARAIEIVDQWNAGQIKHLAAHPASAGHGLNLQKGGAHHILWWGPTVDLDHYIQFNDRLRRQGNVATHVVVHSFVTEQTVDEHADEARNGKDSLQGALLSALTAEIGDSIKVVKETKHGESDMTDLNFKSDAQQTASAPAPAANPFATGQAQAPAPAANPFAAQGQPAAAPAAAPAAQPAANPFAAQGQPAQTPAAQQQAIQQDVAAPPPAQPQPAANPFAAQAPTQPIEDAQVVSETPAGNPFAAGAPATQETTQVQPAPNITASPENRVDPAQPQDTGWTEPQQGAAATAPDAVPAAQKEVATAAGVTAPAGMVPVFTYVPADKLVAVLRGIANAVNK